MIYNKGCKKSRQNVKNIEILRDPPTAFEFGDTATHIERRRVEKQQIKMEEAEKITEGGEGEGEIQEVGGYSRRRYFTDGGDKVLENTKNRQDESERDIEGGGEGSYSVPIQAQERLSVKMCNSLWKINPVQVWPGQ